MSHAEEHTYAENIRNAVMRLKDGDRWQDWDAIGNQWQDRPLTSDMERADTERERALRTLSFDLANRQRDREVQRIAFPAGVTRAKARLQERGESSTVEVREIRLPSGLLCPQLGREFIVQQTNGTTCDVRGLAEAIRKDRPWACPSKNRIPIKRGSKWCTNETKDTPGSIVIRESQGGKPGVVSMMAQYNPGKARQGDDARLRQNWFWQCLGRMESRKPLFKQLAFPKNIGCGLAGGGLANIQRNDFDFRSSKPRHQSGHC